MHQRNRSLFAVLIVLFALSNIGCMKKATPHPNQINSFDGQVYDTLTTAQATLDEAKSQYAAGKLAAVPNAKQIINAGGASYETARTAWMTWRDTVQGTRSGDPAVLQSTLQADMNSLAAAIAKVVTLIGGK